MSGAKSRESTPHEAPDSLSVGSGELLGPSPPGSPARRRKYPALALSPAQRTQQDGGSGSGLIHTHLGEPPDGGFFSEKIHRTMNEKTYINGL